MVGAAFIVLQTLDHARTGGGQNCISGEVSKHLRGCRWERKQRSRYHTTSANEAAIESTAEIEQGAEPRPNLKVDLMLAIVSAIDCHEKLHCRHCCRLDGDGLPPKGVGSRSHPALRRFVRCPQNHQQIQWCDLACDERAGTGDRGWQLVPLTMGDGTVGHRS